MPMISPYWAVADRPWLPAAVSSTWEELLMRVRDETNQDQTAATSWSADGFAQLFQKLDSFRHLKVGWNGYAADPPNEAAVSMAKSFLGLAKRQGELPSRIAPSAAGGVGITQRTGARKVYVEFYNDGTVHALYSDGKSEPEVQPIDPTERGFRRLVAKTRAYLNE
jgi:hypothetical protein